MRCLAIIVFIFSSVFIQIQCTQTQEEKSNVAKIPEGFAIFQDGKAIEPLNGAFHLVPKSFEILTNRYFSLIASGNPSLFKDGEFIMKMIGTGSARDTSNMDIGVLDKLVIGDDGDTTWAITNKDIGCSDKEKAAVEAACEKYGIRTYPHVFVFGSVYTKESGKSIVTRIGDTPLERFQGVKYIYIFREVEETFLVGFQQVSMIAIDIGN